MSSPVVHHAAPAASSSSSSSSSAAAAAKCKGDSKSAKSERKESKAVASEGDFLIQLLAAADRFQVAELVVRCVESLSSTLSVDNLLERAVMAEQSSCAPLQKSCFDFIRADPSRLTEVMESDEWEQLDRKLAHSLVCAALPPSKNVGKKRARPADLAADPVLQPSEDAIKRMKLPELKDKLAAKGLETSGVKADLVERLTNAVHPDKPKAKAKPKARQHKPSRLALELQCSDSSDSDAD